MGRLEEQPLMLMTTPPCHCGPVLEICQNLIPTVALPGESGSKSSTLPHAADSHSSKHHTMCCRVLLLLTPILWHMPDFPQTYVPWVPQHCICQCPSAPPRPLCPWFPKEMSSFQRSLAFPFPCFFQNILLLLLFSPAASWSQGHSHCQTGATGTS